jgi:hypothetical protein
MPSWLKYNTYISSNKLDGLQCEGLFAAYEHIMQTEGGKLGPHDVYRRVAKLFNIWHIGLLHKIGHEYGGKIRETHVERIFKKEGRLIVQGSLGGQVIPQPTTHVIQMGPLQPVNFMQRITSNAKPSMTGAEIEENSQKVACQRMGQLGLSTDGNVCDLRQQN